MTDDSNSRRLYEKLLRAAPVVREAREGARLRVPGLHDVGVQVVERTPTTARILLSRRRSAAAGAPTLLPDMQITIDFNLEHAEARASPSVSPVAAHYPMTEQAVIEQVLEQWLDRMITQRRVVIVNGQGGNGKKSCDRR